MTRTNVKKSTGCCTLCAVAAVHTEKGEEKLNLIMIDDAIPAGAKLG